MVFKNAKLMKNLSFGIGLIIMPCKLTKHDDGKDLESDITLH